MLLSVTLTPQICGSDSGCTWNVRGKFILTLRSSSKLKRTCPGTSFTYYPKNLVFKFGTSTVRVLRTFLNKESSYLLKWASITLLKKKLLMKIIQAKIRRKTDAWSQSLSSYLISQSATFSLSSKTKSRWNVNSWQ
jgi:hypothetical protein